MCRFDMENLQEGLAYRLRFCYNIDTTVSEFSHARSLYVFGHFSCVPGERTF